MNILTIGLGISGSGIVKLLKQRGFNIIAIDGVDNIKILDININFIVKSPGVSKENKILEEAIKRNITIISDIELAFLLKPMEYVAITGTNGKTTVTTLVYEMLKEEFILAGNIGISVCEAILESEKTKVLCELSSFQLEDIKAFKPKIACILNLDEDHIKYHGSKEKYHKAKLNIINNFDENNLLICHESVEDVIPRGINKKVYGLSNIKAGYLCYQDEKIINLKSINVIGLHNYMNILAVIYIAKQYGVSNKRIKEVIINFKGLEHRMEYLGTMSNKVVYNDSKSTNINSTNAAIASFEESIVLILGGYDKFEDYKKLNLKNVVSIIAFGDAKERLDEFFPNVILADDIKESLELSKKENGNIVLFSPGHSSYDQFSSYEQRGSRFKEVYNKR